MDDTCDSCNSIISWKISIQSRVCYNELCVGSYCNNCLFTCGVCWEHFCAFHMSNNDASMCQGCFGKWEKQSHLPESYNDYISNLGDFQENGQLPMENSQTSGETIGENDH